MSEKNGATPAITADDILRLDELEYAEVAVPEWGRRLPTPDPAFSVRIRTLTILEVEQLVKDSTVPDGKGGERRDLTRYNQALFAAGVVRPGFTPADVKSLWTHSSVPVGRILEALQTLNRTAQDTEAAVAEAAKSPATTPDPAPAL